MLSIGNLSYFHCITIFQPIKIIMKKQQYKNHGEYYYLRYLIFYPVSYGVYRIQCKACV